MSRRKQRRKKKRKASSRAIQREHAQLLESQRALWIAVDRLRDRVRYLEGFLVV